MYLNTIRIMCLVEDQGYDTPSSGVKLYDVYAADEAAFSSLLTDINTVYIITTDCIVATERYVVIPLDRTSRATAVSMTNLPLHVEKAKRKNCASRRRHYACKNVKHYFTKREAAMIR